MNVTEIRDSKVKLAISLQAALEASKKGAASLGAQASKAGAFATKHKKLIGGTAAGIGTAALLAKLLKAKKGANALSKSKLTALLKKHKKPLMVGGGAVAGAAGLGALLSNK